MMDVSVNENEVSVLKLESLFFEHLEYTRDSNKEDSDNKLKAQFYVKDKCDDNKLMVTLKAAISGEGLFSLDATLTGIFSINQGDINEWKENAVAILFPYIRSQITLLTSQPNIKPIVLPSVNIHNLLKEENID